jgi:hypothetical protein
MNDAKSNAITPTQLSFLNRLKLVGKPGKTKAERLQDFPEVNYQSSAIGYETLTGRPHAREVNESKATHTTRHSVQSAGGQKLVNGSSCHEYLAMDSMGYAHEFLDKNLTDKYSHLEALQEENTNRYLGTQPTAFHFPSLLHLPSYWFWFFRTFLGFSSVVVYLFFILGGVLLSMFVDGDSPQRVLTDHFTPGFLFYFITLQPLYYLFFKVLHIAGISNLFDPPFLSGAALRRDLGVLRILSKKGEIKDIPFEELEARSTTMWDGGNRAMCKLYLSHKYSKEGLIYGAPHKPAFYVGVLWEFFQHFMDVSRPLPDVPELEPYRHLDPTTREWDKKHNRPERLWRDMPHAEYMELVEASLKVAETYPYLKPSAVKEENWQPAGDGKHWYQLG